MWCQTLHLGGSLLHTHIVDKITARKSVIHP
jgi:hypothetical protein